MEITFRPHHFLCALCFRGRGYSPTFIANFAAIMSMLETAHGENHIINVIDHTDSICSPCPHRTDKTCTSEEKITMLDTAHAAALDIKSGDSMTWKEAKLRIKEKISLSTFHQICETCSWKEFGICESVLREFLK